MQMIDALRCYLCSAIRFGKDEGALDDGLHVQRERPCSPCRCHVARAHRRFDVGVERCGMARDAAFAGLADGRRRLVGLLHHGADKAGEIRQATLQERLAKSHIGENTTQRIGVVMIGRSSKQRPRHLGPIVRRGNGEFILALEMVEKAPFGDARRCAEVINRRG